MGGSGRTAVLRHLAATDKVWRLVDAKGQILGKLASQIAVILMGKHKPIREVSVHSGDPVVVINASQIVVTGLKEKLKLYRKHSGYPGGLSTRTYADIKEQKPTEPLRLAVKRMLPDNRLRGDMLADLRIFPGPTHEHVAQQPQLIPPAWKGKELGIDGAPSAQGLQNVWDSLVRFMPAEDLEKIIREVEVEVGSRNEQLAATLPKSAESEKYLRDAAQMPTMIDGLMQL